MKERIYTIPVNDAFAAAGECPLCSLEDRLSEDLVGYFLGPSLMEPDVRTTTNARGFCRDHLARLYNRQENRLGLGLMLHTHLADLDRDILDRMKRLGGVAGGLFRRKEATDPLRKLAAHLEERRNACALCDRINATMDRYVDVILWQYFNEREFRARFDACEGFCLRHLSLLLSGASRYLDARQAGEMAEALRRIQEACLSRLEADVEWFTLKFDYKNHDKPWGNSRDALPRAIRRLHGTSDLQR